MHFLCLHGLGTNSRILEAQLAAIRHELSDGHTYEYVEGVHPFPMAPEIASYFQSDDGHFAYFDPSRPDTFTKALEDLEKYIEFAGPFDGVIGFSQGAQLAASLLARRNHQDQHRQLFSCAIFLSGVVSHKTDQSSSDMGLLDYNRDVPLINIPTANIWGAHDQSYPSESLLLSRLCRKDWCSVFVHSGGHEIPGPNSKGDLFGSVKAIRRVVHRALTIQ